MNIGDILKSADAPNTIKEAVKLLGTREKPGSSNNATILSWASELEKAMGKPHLGYTADSIPWCGLFVGVVCKRAGWVEQIPATPLWARSWAKFGQKADKPSLGDVMVFSRSSGGHVAFYVAEDDSAYHVIGGNQSDAVTTTRVLKSRLIAARRPIWKIAQPASVRPIKVNKGGALSKNEA